MTHLRSAFYPARLRWSTLDPVPKTERLPWQTVSRDGYADTMQATGNFAPEEAKALFDAAVETVLDSSQYVVWHVPIVGGRKPGPGR